MSLSRNHLASLYDDTDNQSNYATGSISPAANGLLFACVGVFSSPALSSGEVTLSGTLSASWTRQILAEAFFVDVRWQAYLFTAPMGASPGSGTIQFDAPGSDTMDLIKAGVGEFTSSGGSVPTVIQVDKFESTSSSSTASVSLPSARSAGSGGLAFAGTTNNRTLSSWSNGFTERFEAAQGNNVVGYADHTLLTADDVEVTYDSGTTRRFIIMMEVGDPAAAGGGSLVVPSRVARNTLLRM